MKSPVTEPGSIGGLMNRLRMLLVAAALMAGGSALASAQPYDHDGRDGGRYDRDRHFDRDRRDRDDRRFRDRDDRRFVDRDDHRFFEYGGPHYIVGDRRWFNGYYWTWDGDHWW